MKKAVILHGTDGGPTNVPWQSWLKSQLEKSGYDVWFPQLPNCHTPDVSVYDKFFSESGWDFEGNILIGHSSGATTVLHLLNKPDFPKIKAVVLVGAFLSERLSKNVDWYDPGQFDNLFVENFDLDQIRSKADASYFVHGDNDPCCDYDEVKQLCAELGGTLLTIEGGHHLGASSGVTELTLLVKTLSNDGLLD